MSKTKSNTKELDSVSKRLKHVIETLGVKQSHMAEKLGISPAGLNYILNNDVKFSKNAKKMAGYLKINEHWLQTGEGEAYQENTSIVTYQIPLYYPDQLRLFFQSKGSLSLKSNTFFITTTAYEKKTLAIYNTENNFSPKFEIGDMLAFEQTQNFSDGEILLVYCASSDNIFLKTGFYIGNEVILLDAISPPLILKSSDGDRIIGCYRECIKKQSIINEGRNDKRC